MNEGRYVRETQVPNAHNLKIVGAAFVIICVVLFLYGGLAALNPLVLFGVAIIALLAPYPFYRKGVIFEAILDDTAETLTIDSPNIFGFNWRKRIYHYDAFTGFKLDMSCHAVVATARETIQIRNDCSNFQELCARLEAIVSQRFPEITENLEREPARMGWIIGIAGGALILIALVKAYRAIGW